MTAVANLLITGPSGFLGRHLLERLQREDGVILHAVNRSGEGPRPDRVTWHAANLLDPDAPEHLIARIRPTHLLHCAWQTAPGRFWTDRENIDWLHASGRLMESFARLGGRHFAGIGTCAEYDGGAETFVEDTTPIRPFTLYGKAKAAVWAAAEAHAAAGHFTAVWGRIFLPYGPGDTDGRLLPTLIKEFMANRSMKLGDGKIERDFIFAPDAADLIVQLLIGHFSGAFNVGTGRATPIAEAVGYVADRLQRRHLLQFNARPAVANEPKRLVADMTKVQRMLGWQAPTPLAAGLDTIVEAALKDINHGNSEISVLK